MILLDDNQSISNYIESINDIEFISMFSKDNLAKYLEYDTKKRYDMIFMIDNVPYIDDSNQGKYRYNSKRINRVKALMLCDFNKLSLVKKAYLSNTFNIDLFADYYISIHPNDLKEDYYFVLKMLNDDELYNKFSDPYIREHELGIDLFKYYGYLKIMNYLFGNSFDSYGLPTSEFSLFCNESLYRKLAYRTYQIQQPVNEELKEEILNELNPQMDRYQIVLKVYYELCKRLSYDQKYLYTRFNNNDEYYDSEYRSDHEFSKTINSKNNQIVCFEFNHIFSSILTQLGINARYYGMDHAATLVAIDQDEARFDAIKVDHYSKENDLYRAKLRKPLQEITIMSDDNNKFSNAIRKLDEEINQERINTLLDQFIKTRSEEVKEVNIDIQESISKLQNELNNIKINDLDLTIYITRLFKNGYFGHNSKITFVGLKNELLFDRHIIIYNSEYYYVIDTHKAIIYPITYDKLLSLLEEGEMYYEKDTKTIEAPRGRNK